MYMQEAFGCMKCSVNVENIDGGGISRLRRGLIRPQRTVPWQLVANPPTQNQLSPRSQRRENDNKFKPPVPLPARFVEVGTINSECELSIYKNSFSFTHFSFIRNSWFFIFFSAHALIVQIREEHNYSRTQQSE